MSGDTQADTPGDTPEDTQTVQVRRRWIVWAVAAVVAVAVAFGGGATWAKGRLPFTSAAPSCWGVDLSALFPHRATSTQDIAPYGDTTPECRIMVGVDRGRSVDATSDVFYADLDELDSDSAERRMVARRTEGRPVSAGAGADGHGRRPGRLGGVAARVLRDGPLRRQRAVRGAAVVPAPGSDPAGGRRRREQ